MLIKIYASAFATSVAQAPLLNVCGLPVATFNKALLVVILIALMVLTALPIALFVIVKFAGLINCMLGVTATS